MEYGMLLSSIAKWQLIGIFIFGDFELKKKDILETEFLVVLLNSCT